MVSEKSFDEQVVEEFRANGGKVGGIFENWKMLLLTTTGKQSGQPRLVPLVYTTDGDDIVIIASNAGAPTHPGWYHNILADPRATVEVGTETFQATAAVVSGAERQRLYDAQVAELPQFAEYQRKTTREIPVVRLRKVGN